MDPRFPKLSPPDFVPPATARRGRPLPAPAAVDLTFLAALVLLAALALA